MHLTSAVNKISVKDLIQQFEALPREKNYQVAEKTRALGKTACKISAGDKKTETSAKVSPSEISMLATVKKIDQVAAKPVTEPASEQPPFKATYPAQANSFIKLAKETVLGFIQPLSEKEPVVKDENKESETRERSQTLKESIIPRTMSLDKSIGRSDSLDKFFSKYETLNKKEKLHYNSEQEVYQVRQRSRSAPEALTGKSDKTIAMFENLLNEIRELSHYEEILINGQTYSVKQVLDKVTEGAWGQTVIKNNKSLQKTYNEILEKSLASAKGVLGDGIVHPKFVETQNFLQENAATIIRKHRKTLKNAEGTQRLTETIQGRNVEVIYQNKQLFLYSQDALIGHGKTRDVYFGIHVGKHFKIEAVAVAKGMLTEVESGILNKVSDNPYTIKTKAAYDDLTVYEYCKENCTELLKTFNESQKDQVAYQVIDALKTIHGQGIAHGDLKWDNIMLTSKGRVKVIDFGEAESHPLMAAKGMPADASSLGQMLYELYFDPEESLVSQTVKNQHTYEPIVYELRGKDAEVIKAAIEKKMKKKGIEKTDKNQRIVGLIVDLLKKDGRINLKDAHESFKKILLN